MGWFYFQIKMGEETRCPLWGIPRGIMVLRIGVHNGV